MVNNWSELLTAVKEAQKDIRGNGEVWFRGHANSSYVLMPSLFRYDNAIKKEKEIFRLYKQVSQKISPNRISDWETLFDMQHYYSPTRLLDWTENLGTALYFAVQYPKENTNAALYILDPIALNRYSQKTKIPNIPDDSDGMDYIENYLEKRPYPPKYPIAIRPNFISDRLSAQRGAFTVHGDDLTPLEKLCPDAIKRIDISRECFPEITEFLDIANITELTVFPDMSGLALYIRKQFFS